MIDVTQIRYSTVTLDCGCVDDRKEVWHTEIGWVLAPDAGEVFHQFDCPLAAELTPICCSVCGKPEAECGCEGVAFLQSLANKPGIGDQDDDYYEEPNFESPRSEVGGGYIERDEDVYPLWSEAGR